MEEIQQLKSDVSEIKKEVSEVKVALLGNEFNNYEGFVHHATQNSKDIGTLKAYVLEERTRAEAREKRDKKFSQLIQLAVWATVILTFCWMVFVKINKAA